MAGKYRRTAHRGFRKFAMAFWDRPRAGLIYGHLTMDVLKTRRFQEDVQAKFDVYPAMGHILGRGLAVALTKVPEVNAKIIWGRAYIKDTADVYFQVDVADGKDLSGVVVPDTGSKSVVEVATILRERAKRLRGGQDEQYEKTQKGCLGMLPSFAIRWLLGTLTFLEYNLGITPTFLGAKPEPFGTVMLTNVSKFGIDVAYAPLVPASRVPLVVLMGQVKLGPVVTDEGKLEVRPTLTGSATFDHRVVDGNKIGKFIRTVKAYVEDPYAFETELGLEDPGPPSSWTDGWLPPEQRPETNEPAQAPDAAEPAQEGGETA